MSNYAYYLAWLAAGLALTAIASAAIARHFRLRVARRAQGAALLDALARYSGWVAAQRRLAFFQGDTQDADGPLRQVRDILQKWFPELAAETGELFSAHAGLIEFLWSQQLLRLKDAEAWIESNHDTRFMTLWRAHRHAVHAIGEKMKRAGGVVDDEVDAGSTFPA